MKPDLNLLTVLDAICRTGSVSGAAQALSLSQPAVSHALARLRRATADPLFIRSGRRFVPTPHAVALARPVAELVAAGSALLGPSDFRPQVDSTVFRIGASDYAALTLLPGLVARLQDLAPAAAIEVLPIVPGTLRHLEDGEFDLAFWGTAAPPPPLHYHRLLDEHFVAVLRLGHPALAATGELTLAAYLQHRHATVSLKDPGTSPVDKALADLGLTRRPGLVSHSFAGNLAAVAQSDLIATLPARICAALAPGLTSQPLPLSLPPFAYGMIWHDRTETSPAQRWLRALIAGIDHGR